MKTDKELFVEAYMRGHAWNPAYPDLANLDLTGVHKLDGSERTAKDLIASRQASDVNMNVFVAAFHKGRDPQFDGGIGPATRALAELDRCPIPDFAPPPGASFDMGDPELNKIVESQQRAAAEGFVGSYWRGCDPEQSKVHSFVLGIDTSRAPKNWLANRDKILAAYVACLAQIGIAVRIVLDPQSLDGLQQFQAFKSIAGSTIGYNYFPNSNSCGRISTGYLDTGYDPSDWRYHACLKIHESGGHGIGFNHTRGGMMNPSIVLVDPISYVNDPAWSQVVRYYPGKPLTVPVPPTPTPTPDESVWLRNIPGAKVGQEVVALKDFVARKDQVLGRFLSVPTV